MQQPEVVIYTTPTCTYCAAAKRWFKDHGVSYTEYDVSRDPVRAAEVYRLTGQGAVPVIRVGQQVLVGFDPLQLAKLIPTSTNGNGAAPADGASKVSLGMAAQTLTGEKAAEVGLPAPFGVLVGPVRAGGPAEAAGLREGDVLVGVGSYTLQNLAQLQSLVASKQPGDSLTLRVWRQGEELEKTITFPAPEGADTPDDGASAAAETADSTQ
jgi:serine protease Do